ncbi:glycoside hydrolase family 16 protein [Exilibacterium tricleocarpae]|uniref:Glycoside hydrolase family 16 protein n=1 Tax=Exilibacterium tricleocarpae TaxID=2591008 RepID=A0A545T1R6_9GAMM|nr:glycoside hydrolase family 16 protein [Exilibacterium tricleocarpae]TQV71167.1 glycoside hydrolase family 16 protein [Exilibacterium tricleocarpae]
MPQSFVRIMKACLLLSSLSCATVGCNPWSAGADATTADTPEAIFFDDFHYTTFDAFRANGWRARTETGHPGVVGATWSQDGISFHPAAAGARKGMVRLTSVTDGSAANTRHTQFCHARKYLYGTYAARVYFRDAPSQGPDGDEVIQTFYAISPLEEPMHPDYSEMDFEYLPNGGWGEGELALWATSWETFQLEPWTKVNEYDTTFGSLEGWHTLTMHATKHQLRYYIDGRLFAEHSAKVAPEVPMSINFNLWFTAEGAIDSDALRSYQEDVDWVFHAVGQQLSSAEVEARVAALRAAEVTFTDSVAEMTPPLPSPCGL